MMDIPRRHRPRHRRPVGNEVSFESPTVHAALRRVLADHEPFQEILIGMGQGYRRALDGWERQHPH